MHSADITARRERIKSEHNAQCGKFNTHIRTWFRVVRSHTKQHIPPIERARAAQPIINHHRDHLQFVQQRAHQTRYRTRSVSSTSALFTLLVRTIDRLNRRRTFPEPIATRNVGLNATRTILGNAQTRMEFSKHPLLESDAMMANIKNITALRRGLCECQHFT